MRKFNIQNMTGGWFVGNFEPTAYRTTETEVAYKQYKAGDSEPSHHHKQATELTLIVYGTVQMNDHFLQQGEIVSVDKHESVAFKAITDAATVVVKVPSVRGDKYPD
jgi:uncharacterized cupin superfamily protein